MPTYSPLDTKEQVRQAIDIVDLVGSYLQLRRQGRNYVALCPWHDDSRPSLQINPERQSFKCWVCDIGGDIFSFIMKMEGVDFREALTMLADRAGVAMQAPRQSAGGDSGSETSVGGAPDKRTLFQAMAWAEGQYHDCLLNAPEGKPARDYLSQRQVTPENIEKFHLGFSPNQRDWILGRVEGSAERTSILEKIGLVARPAEGGSLYDRFRGRVLFSIRDVQGRPVGLGGRVLPESGATSPAKYVNSPETPLFSKSNLLYGLDVAREAVRKSRTVLITEGYTDCIAAHQFGFENTVAVLGTALGENHIKILKRFADRIVLVLDGDEAGQKRAGEVLELFVAQNVDMQVLTLPEGSDPCDFLQQHGAEAFSALLENEAVDALDHAFITQTRGVDLDRDVHGASEALERLVAIVAKAPRLRHDTTRGDRFREEKVLQRLAASFRVDEAEVRRRMTALRRGAARRVAIRQPVEQPPDDIDLSAEELEQSINPPREIDPGQRELLELLVAQPDCLAALREKVRPEWFTVPACRHIYETCCRLADGGTVPDFERLMLEFDQPGIKSLLVELDEKGQQKGFEDAPALVQQLISKLEQKEVDKQRPAQIVALREGGLDESQQSEMLEQILRQERDRHGISKPTDG